MDKGLDAMFIHYGIRREDMAIIKKFVRRTILILIGLKMKFLRSIMK